MPRFDHIMIDLETLALSPDAVIAQFGAVAFDPETGIVNTDNPFSGQPNLDQAGRHIDGDTVAWWMRQSAEARKIFDGAEERAHLELILLWLSEWASEIGARYVWAQGASFDLPILKHALAQRGLGPWWRYSNERDTRTFFAAAESVCGTAIRVDREKGIHHTAVDDAIAQAETVCRAYGILSNKVPEFAS